MSGLMARSGMGALRAYFRHFPIRAGKQSVWDRFVGPYIAWRRFETVATTKFGAKFNIRLPDFIHGYIYFFGIWEPLITEYVMRALRPGDTFIDVGANIGYDSLLASSQVGSAGRVFAIEASPTIFGWLQENIALNQAKNIEAFNVAASDRPGEVTLYLNSQGHYGSSTTVVGLAEQLGETRSEKVRALPLTAIIEPSQIRKARIIKIDVEGAEWMVVQGFKQLVGNLSGSTEIIMEVHRPSLANFGASPEDLIKIFATQGYEPFTIENKYSSQFYVSPPPLTLQPLCSNDFELIDLIFRRSAG